MTNSSLDRNVIYGLYCLCHYSQIRYIGQTSQGAAARLGAHISMTKYRIKNGKRLSHSQNWIASHGYENIAITVLEVCLDSDDLNACEERWLADLNGLTNIRSGGSQSRGWKMPAGINAGERNPMYGIKRPDVGELNRVLKTGTTWNDEAKAAKGRQAKEWIAKNGHPMRGKKHTLESRAKISAAGKGKRTGDKNPMYGRRYTEAERRVLSMAASSFTEDDIREIRRLKSEYKLLNREIALKYGVDQSQISKIINRKRYGWID